MFIERLSLSSNVDQINSELSDLLKSSPWPVENQLGLTCRPDCQRRWYDSVGSLYDRANLSYVTKESEFTEWNIDTSYYIREQLELLQTLVGARIPGRVRFMKLLPKTGLSVHRDPGFRYHLVLKTNPRAYISHSVDATNSDCSDLPVAASCYNMPLDSHWYRIDTKQWHWVYNGGPEERIHLVSCAQ
jgi:hypothetical protein